MGRQVYEDALTDPESLAIASALRGVEDIFFEEFSYVVDRVLEDREAPPATAVRTGMSAEPSGQPWTEEDLPARFPKLWSVYGRGHT